jgi:hypothetical protein
MKQGAFIGGQPGTGMPFHNPHHIFRNTMFPAPCRPGLGMGEGVGEPPADVMEQGPGVDELTVGYTGAVTK